MILYFFFFLFSISYLLSYSQVASLAARLLQYAAIINHPTVCQRSISTLFGTTLVFGTELLNKYPIKSVKVIRKFRYPGKTSSKLVASKTVSFFFYVYINLLYVINDNSKLFFFSFFYVLEI